MLFLPIIQLSIQIFSVLQRINRNTNNKNDYKIEKYDYLQAVMDDVRNFIEENDIVITSSNVDEMREELYDKCWADDSVTGNASGSYTFCTWDAEENLCHNWDLLQDALEEFGYDESYNAIQHGAEWCDVTIRCYLLAQAIDKVLDSMEIQDDEEDEEENEETDF